MEGLTPTVKHGEEADRGTQMLGICCNRQQGLSHCPEENAVDFPGIL